MKELFIVRGLPGAGCHSYEETEEISEEQWNYIQALYLVRTRLVSKEK